MRVSHKSAEVDCNLIVLDCENPLLCGRDLLQKIEGRGAATSGVKQGSAPVHAAMDH